MEAAKLERLVAASRERRRSGNMKREGQREFVPFANICGRCAYFDRDRDTFEGSNRRECTLDGREHWAGDDACERYDAKRR